MDNKIKALCDYLLGYWESEIECLDDLDSDNEETNKIFNEYFISKYGVNFEYEFNIVTNSWKRAHIELNKLLDKNNNKLSTLLIGMQNKSFRNKQNIEKLNKMLLELYVSKMSEEQN